jgi:hypothetical protein
MTPQDLAVLFVEDSESDAALAAAARGRAGCSGESVVYSRPTRWPWRSARGVGTSSCATTCCAIPVAEEVRL